MTRYGETNNPRLLAIIVAAISLPLLVLALIAEVDPLAGTWEVHRAFEDGKEVPYTEGGLYMEISRGHAVIEASRFCGNMPRQIFAEGKIVPRDNVLALHSEVDPLTNRLSPYPSAELVRLPSGHLVYEANLGDGKLTRLEFVRVQNRSTVLDLLGWQ